MRDTGDRFKGRQHRQFSPQPTWLQQLWKQQQVPLGEDTLRWWSVHVENFLAALRRHQWQGAVRDLADSQTGGSELLALNVQRLTFNV